MRLERHTSTPRTRRWAKGFAPLLTALLAVFLQAFVVQTHVHAFGVASVPAIERSSETAAAHADETASPLHKASCLFCETLASSSRAMLPSAAAVEAQPDAAPEAALRLIRQPPRFSSHAWRSRAPPIRL